MNIAASATPGNSDSIQSLRDRRQALEDSNRILREEIESLRERLKERIQTSKAFEREIHDRAEEAVARKLVSRVTRCTLLIGNEKLIWTQEMWTQEMWTEKLAILRAKLSGAPSEFSKVVDVLRAEEGGEEFGRIYDQMIEDRAEEVQKKINEMVTDRALKAGVTLAS